MYNDVFKKMNKITKSLKINGYAIIKKFFFKKEINHILKSFEENIDYCYSLISKDKKKTLDEKYLFLQKKNNILKSRSYDLSKYDPSIYKFSTNYKLEKILKNYFKEKYFIDLPQIRVDDISNSYMLPLHQEIYGQLSSSLLTLWAPLTKVSKKNGTLAVIKGSHNNGLLKHQYYKINKNKYHGVKKNLLKGKKITYLNLLPGDIVLFHPLLVHGTGKNYTNKIRWTFVARYNGISGIEYLNNNNHPLRIEQKV